MQKEKGIDNMITNNPLVYIVMPVYNGEKYLLEQLMSIYYQNYTNWYLITINDGSTDSSEQIVKDFISCYNLNKKAKIITKKNGGVNSAIGRGLEEVKKVCDIHNTDSLISYCDQDDIRTREKLSLQVEYMVEHPECGLSFHDLSIIDENGILTNSSELRNKYLKNFSFFGFGIIGNFLISAEMMFKAEYIDDILPMAIGPCIYQDERTIYVLSLKGVNIQCINKQLAYHRIGHQSLLKTSNKVGKKQYYINKQKMFNFLQERFPEKDLSYIINFKYDRYIKRFARFGLISPIIYILILFKYPRAFFLLAKVVLYKFYKLIIKLITKMFGGYL